MLNVEERILDYVGRCYGERGQVPSVREILDDMNVSRYRFYLIFPNGIGGVCNALGLPIPMDGMRRTRSASDARRAKERKDLSEKYGDLHLRYSMLLKEANALKEEAARLREENASLNQRAGGLRYEVEELKRERDHLAKRLNEVSVNMSLSGEAVREAEKREKMLRMELEKLRNELISCTSTTAPRLLNAIESRLKKEEEELARIVDEEVKRHGLRIQ